MREKDTVKVRAYSRAVGDAVTPRDRKKGGRSVQSIQCSLFFKLEKTFFTSRGAELVDSARVKE